MKTFGIRPHLTSELEAELLVMSKREISETVSDLVGPAIEDCRQPGRAFIDLHASEKELELLRSESAVAFADIFREEHSSPHLIDCLEAGIASMPTHELVALLQGSRKLREAIVTRVAKKGC